MAHITVPEPFDDDQLAAQFPGRLIFRRAPASEPGDTEIQGDVPIGDLVAALETCLLDPTKRVIVGEVPMNVTIASPLPVPPSVRFLQRPAVSWTMAALIVLALLLQLLTLVR